ncbi:MAG: hypothetical protein IKJ80_01045 [Clostridia bacterium]|nr:hypothetical protein [Clostridia bacterium]
MFRNCWRSLMYQLGLVAIVFIIFSLVFHESVRINHLYHMVCAVIPAHLFSFFTMWLKLFSKRIWIRRAIIMAFDIFTLYAVGYAVGTLRFEFDSLTVYGIVSLGVIIAMVFAFYVADKIEEQNLKLINQKLGEKNTSNME